MPAGVIQKDFGIFIVNCDFVFVWVSGFFQPKIYIATEIIYFVERKREKMQFLCCLFWFGNEPNQGDSYFLSKCKKIICKLYISNFWYQIIFVLFDLFDNYFATRYVDNGVHRWNIVLVRGEDKFLLQLGYLKLKGYS